jgi:hypothetical protein
LTSTILGALPKHIDDVKKVVLEEGLLVFDMSEGWAPLCEFVNVEIPREAFPHTNTRTSFSKYKPT